MTDDNDNNNNHQINRTRPAYQVFYLQEREGLKQAMRRGGVIPSDYLIELKAAKLSLPTKRGTSLEFQAMTSTIAKRWKALDDQTKRRYEEHAQGSSTGPNPSTLQNEEDDDEEVTVLKVEPAKASSALAASIAKAAAAKRKLRALRAAALLTTSRRGLFTGPTSATAAPMVVSCDPSSSPESAQGSSRATAVALWMARNNRQKRLGSYLQQGKMVAVQETQRQQDLRNRDLTTLALLHQRRVTHQAIEQQVKERLTSSLRQATLLRNMAMNQTREQSSLQACLMSSLASSPTKVVAETKESSQRDVLLGNPI